MRTAYFDLVAGAGGDMLLAALVDAGAPLPALREHLDRLGLGARLEASRAVVGYLAATRVRVEAPADPQPERHLGDVLAIIGRADLPARAAERAERIFRALAAAEGRVHGMDPDEVHFHEVGAVDSIVDTVGVAVALELLGVDRIESSPLPVALGTTQAAHGTLPLPAPAVLYLAEAAGAPLEGREGTAELVTPTAAAVLTALAARFGPYPAIRVAAAGTGAGARTSPPGALPNVCRVVLGEVAGAGDTVPGAAGLEVIVLEASLDDQSPELTAYLTESLLAAGALDVHLTPVLMKKGRPGALVTVLAAPSLAGAFEELLLRESSTLGVRSRRERRSVLPREERAVETPYGVVRVKRTVRPGGRRTAAPEYEDCARLARERGAPLAEVYRAALRAADALEG